MKPDWKDAPKWANWLAKDKDGVWCWYDKEPAMHNRSWFPKGKVAITNNVDIPWKKSLEQRPK